MKLTTFKYTDAKGKESNRTILTTCEPSIMHKGIDVSHVDTERLELFVARYKIAQQNFYAEIEEIKALHELTDRFRQFYANKMENIVTQEV